VPLPIDNREVKSYLGEVAIWQHVTNPVDHLNIDDFLHQGETLKRSVALVWLFLIAGIVAPCMAQPIQTDRNVTGQILCYAVMYPNIYVGTTDGIFRSSDRGKTWIGIGQDIVDQAVHSINLVSQNVFAATEGLGVLRSTNGGEQWEAANDGVKNKYILSIAIDGSRVFAGTTNGGIYMSENAGAGWLDVHEGLPKDVNVFSLAVVGHVVYAGTQRGIFTASSDNLKWSKISDAQQKLAPSMWTDRIVP
jgi:photosystem II stability/assembly factor-like uncharacterized protein